MATPPERSDVYDLLRKKAEEIQNELRHLDRWQEVPLPSKKFEDMGAFGSNTMTLEQWIQFILIPRLDHIVTHHGELPSQSMLSTYAIRVLDGDLEASKLIDLLNDIDELVNAPPQETNDNYAAIQSTDLYLPQEDAISVDDETIPQVVYSLAEILAQFEGDDLKSQLQTFDIFIGILKPSARQVIGDLLRKSAAGATSSVTRERIERAAEAVAQGGRAAEPYNHDDAMRRYRDKQEDNF
jgi:uncharacterized protein YqcC (DUF446 family)